MRQTTTCWKNALLVLASSEKIAKGACSEGIGLEDNLWLDRGVLARTNAEQVLRVRQIIEGLGLEVATPAEAREILNLKGGDNVGF